jgi:hypothetical protein
MLQTIWVVTHFFQPGWDFWTLTLRVVTGFIQPEIILTRLKPTTLVLINYL